MCLSLLFCSRKKQTMLVHSAAAGVGGGGAPVVVLCGPPRAGPFAYAAHHLHYSGFAATTLGPRSSSHTCIDPPVVFPAAVTAGPPTTNTISTIGTTLSPTPSSPVAVVDGGVLPPFPPAAPSKPTMTATSGRAMPQWRFDAPDKSGVVVASAASSDPSERSGHSAQPQEEEEDIRNMTLVDDKITASHVPALITRLEVLIKQETVLVQELRQMYEQSQPLASIDLEQSKKLGTGLHSVLESKRAALAVFLTALAPKEQLARVAPVVSQDLCELPGLSICIQPADVAVANRYLLPSPEIEVSPPFRARDGCTLIVSARLLYHASGQEVSTTHHGRQDILQGIRQINVDKNSRASFSKLKVMEVSSKHRHQSFCLLFALEEYSPQGSKRTLGEIKSTPFHVQSRPAKRKLHELADDPPVPLGDSTTPSDEISDGSLTKKKSKKGKANCEERLALDCNYIDITDLLTLPQKEAARRLGISESMLCKRFKECTRRKWPYRYLRKIDKVINMLNLHKTDGIMARDDQDKLGRLNKEREECLRPVKIRITSYDRVDASGLSPMMRLRNRSADCDEEDIPIDALETLEMLKSSTERSDLTELETPKKPESELDASNSESDDMVEQGMNSDDEGMFMDESDDEVKETTNTNIQGVNKPEVMRGFHSNESEKP
eukprot:TRINITY_DN4505_c0_g1_i4.p1 TRINITY_DN4505_c0_g1~~TRINITY_DN4505_c0_g1_i4.p1  ORF type:complete len:665 (+),score=93.47 TRINITY_DN4505_c0_g1_i4:14-2008(+)